MCCEHNGYKDKAFSAFTRLVLATTTGGIGHGRVVTTFSATDSLLSEKRGSLLSKTIHELHLVYRLSFALLRASSYHNYYACPSEVPDFILLQKVCRSLFKVFY